MSTEGDWTIRPRQGVGRLEFGMSAVQVDALSDVYGSVSGRGSDRVPDALLLETLEMFGDAMTAQEKDAFLSVYAENGPAADSVTEARGDPGLVLGYDADRLVQIMSAIGHRTLLLDGRDVFSLGPMEALAFLELRNGGPGRFADTEASFDNLAISVSGFSIARSDGIVRTPDETGASFRERTVTVRQCPYLPESDKDRFFTHSFTG